MSDREEQTGTDSHELEWGAQRRHEENIQLLVALGILGGYITLLSNGLFENRPLNLVVTALATVTLGFLALKLTLHSVSSLKELERIRTLDQIASKVQLGSVWGFIVLIGAYLASNQIDVTVSNLSDYLAPAIFVSGLVIVPLSTYLGAKYQHKQANEDFEKIRERLPIALGHLEKGEILDENRRESIEARLLKLIEIDSSKSIWAAFDAGFAQMIGEDGFCFRKPERELLVSTITRIENRAEFDDYDESDLETIENILEKAERRYSP